MADEKTTNSGTAMDCMSSMGKMKEMMRSMMAKGESCFPCSGTMSEMMSACCADAAGRTNEAEKDPPA